MELHFLVGVDFYFPSGSFGNLRCRLNDSALDHVLSGSQTVRRDTKPPISLLENPQVWITVTNMDY